MMNMQKFVRGGFETTSKNLRMIRQQAGFTLIEIMAVLVIIGVISSVGVQKYDQLTESASQRVLDYAFRELNSRELLTWGLIKISDEGWLSDEALFARLDTRIGEGYGWSSGPGLNGGTLRTQSASLALTRIASTINTTGKWEVQ
jgi:prepilin-type N-terminal cleavage/methylation domain-containing protein